MVSTSMSLLSKAELQFLQGQKNTSKSYEYKLKSVIKKKLSMLIEKEIPLIKSLYPDIDLTKSSKINPVNTEHNLTKFSKKSKISGPNKKYPLNGGKSYYSNPNSTEIQGTVPKYYINNPPKLIKNTDCSGGVEANTSHTIRLSISPSQGDDPGFKSRPEHS